MEFRRLLFKALGLTVNHCDYTDSENLTVRLTGRCRNNCKFCIERKSGTVLTDAPIEELIEKVNSSRFKRIMATGGEPCLDMNRLVKFFECLNKDITVSYLNTSLPIEAYRRKDELKRVIERCELIDISAHGNSNEEDAEAFGRDIGYDKQSFIAELAQWNPKKVYVSCVMRASHFRDMDDVRSRVRHYYGMGIRNLYLNELGNDRAFERDADFVALDELLERSGYRTFGSPYTRGCKTDISALFQDEFPGVSVKVRRRCFLCGAGETVDLMDLFKFWVNKHFRMRIANVILNSDGTSTYNYPMKGFEPIVAPLTEPK